jgi:hypothetical protein
MIDIDLVMNQVFSSYNLEVTNQLFGSVWISTPEDTLTWSNNIASEASGNIFFRTWNNIANQTFSANHHNGTSGGLPVGAGGVDLQLIRSSATQAATGIGATLLGGSQSTAGGIYSVAAGYQCVVNSNYSLVLGSAASIPAGATASAAIGQNIVLSPAAGQSFGLGINHSISNEFCLAIGGAQTISGKASFAIGSNSIVSGNSSGAVGNFITVPGNNSMGFGDYAQPWSNNRHTQSGGIFGKGGDYQASKILMRATTSGTAATSLTCDGTGVISSTNITIIYYPGSLYQVSIRLTAVDTTNLGNAIVWYLPIGLLSQFYGVGSTIFSPGTPQSITVGTGSLATVTIHADTTYGGIYPVFTAPNSDAWHIVAEVCFVEVA